MEDLVQRLVVRRKSDGRCVYDEEVKAELVALCGRPGASVSRLAREAGVNANQLSRWVREHGEQRRAAVVPVASKFVAVPMEMSKQTAATLSLQASLPNGVRIELKGCDTAQACEVIETLGRTRCSASMKG